MSITTHVGQRYALERELGSGAGGAVWLAHDELLDRAVAVKRLPRSPGDTEVSLRAAREARLAARVSHPHVVSVFDLVEDDDELWLVMEHVEGRSLSELLRADGPLSPDEAAELLAPIADALASAHDNGVVHRDIKPSNILVTSEGVAKLTDFGIARGDDDATLTQTGIVTGSPAYLAPEVACGGTADKASDVWSFGATLVHALTGRPPYHQEDGTNGALAVVYRVVHEPPPRPSEAGWLAPLVAATLTPEPDERPDMATVRDLLERPDTETEATAALDLTALDLAPVLPAPRPSQPPQSQAPQLQLPSHLPPPPLVPPPPPGAGPARPGGQRRRRRSRHVGVIAAVGATAVLAALAVGVALTRDHSGSPTAAVTASGSPDAGASDAGKDVGEDAGASAPSAETLEAFAEDYVRTAHRDPAAGFALLTPGYQDESPAYTEFWRSVRSPKVLSVSGDPATMTVTYTYSYALPGEGRRTEQVTLDLVESGDRLLIAGASSVPVEQ
ncbi:serine/threonine protein kinase [Nocardioides sp. zg-536]|uniref:non-specific serine/threonine protein kinase n=1 Tax=Nocardioides faecalis TaxID=2803858 RepID=A0A938Y163_9ACTN|nr:serine/threonine-protein kinase [Nocardioides faecalis]MBM9460262.1 serine/threonine protein kinase [Nocardioides faecalis]QVI59897.1 serine/threonine protein kinase [Nocardioides faecalis]